MKVRYFGHSCFLIDNLLVDPFITGNPNCNVKKEDIKCDIICVTHDHPDHIGDAFQIAKNNNAVLVAIHEIAEEAASKGLRSEGMNIGGQIKVGEWEIKMVLALHSSSKGHPAGFVLRKEGKTFYHAGDTGLFGDMKLIGEEGIDIAMLPVGDRYTMGVKDALRAVDFIKPKIAVPMHYGTFPIINPDPGTFTESCPVKVEEFKFNEEKEL